MADCSRCGRPIADYQPSTGGMTAGYYVASAWQKYANPGEVYICDACMWSDPRYIADYGTITPLDVRHAVENLDVGYRAINRLRRHRGEGQADAE